LIRGDNGDLKMAANQMNKTLKHPLGLIISNHLNMPHDVEIIKNQLQILNFKLLPTIEPESKLDLEEKLNEDCTSAQIKSYDFLLCFIFGKAYASKKTTSFSMRDHNGDPFDCQMLTQHFKDNFPSKPKLFIYHIQKEIEKLGDSDGDDDSDGQNLNVRSGDNIGFVYSYTEKQDGDSEFISKFCQAINSNQSLETIFSNLSVNFGKDLTCDFSHFERNICLSNILPHCF
jgi:hypothetical protein